MVRRLSFDEPTTPTPAAAPAPSPQSGPINLNKISLEKKGQSINLEKTSSKFGDIVINLNWNQQPAEPEKKGFWSSLVGSEQMDLDLGLLFEMRDGEVGGIQALGDDFGDFDNYPYIELDGDDRSGSNTEGETIRINGEYWDEIQRVIVFAYIYEGAANWDATDAVVTITVKGQPPIEVRLTGGRNDRTMCGIALLENENGQIRVSREVEYVRGHEQLDELYDWGLDWTPARK